VEHPDQAINHIVENAERQTMKSLTPDEVVGAATKVFNGQPETWLSINYVYDQLCRHPKRFGFESTQQLPLRRDFEAICRSGAFQTDRMGGQVLIRPHKKG
jgi:hypothetical protein